MLVREPLVRLWLCELLDCDIEDTLWVKRSNVASDVDMMLALCASLPSNLGERYA